MCTFDAATNWYTKYTCTHCIWYKDENKETQQTYEKKWKTMKKKWTAASIMDVAANACLSLSRWCCSLEFIWHILNAIATADTVFCHWSLWLDQVMCYTF